MSLRTRIRGYTAWVNLRLTPYMHLMNNVLLDLMTGTNMKFLVESLTGREMNRLHNFDSLTQQQKITRVEWVLVELKKCKVIPEDVKVDSRMFAMKSADHVFGLLWKLVCHDIWFVWERAEYFQQSDEIICEVPLVWIPQPPPETKKKKFKTKTSLLSGFGASSVSYEPVEEEQEEEGQPEMEFYERFARSDYVMKYKGKQRNQSDYPGASSCIMEMITKQLKMVAEGRKLNISDLDDLADSRVLCALVNSFIPNTFTTEILLNDRWSINLILRTTEKMFHLETPLDSGDLAEADPMAICSYFCSFFMVAYKYKQNLAAVNRMDFLKKELKVARLELDTLPPNTSNMQQLERRQRLKTDVECIQVAIEELEKKYDLAECNKWVEYVKDVVKQTHKDIKAKIKQRFDTIKVPRGITINNLCLSMIVNLNFTNGVGFYLLEEKESLNEGRRVVLRDRDTGEFLDDFTSKSREAEPIRRMLRLQPTNAVDVNPSRYRHHEIYFEALSKNKLLRTNTVFMYQIFPGTTYTWHKIFTRAARDNDLEAVKRMVVFFKPSTTFINGKEPGTGNSALHVACRYGHYNIALYLLENGSNIDQRNSSKQTALFSACEGLQKNLAHLLIEWGCDVHVRGPRNQTAFETVKNDEMRNFLIDTYEHYSTVVPKIMEGDLDLLYDLLQQHKTGIREFNNLRSRWINGSTILHTAAYFGCGKVISEVLDLGLDINLLDYKGATAVHRAKDTDTIQILVEAGAQLSVDDAEGNTPLHVKCYGETGHPADIDILTLLMGSGAKLTARNHRGLMPIHCCAMQGRDQIIRMIMKFDREALVKSELESEGKTPPSLIYLALANDFTSCATWLRQTGFTFKDGEKEILLQRILSEQIKLNERVTAIQFLLDCGASPNPKYPGGNTALHFAACMTGTTDVLELLISYGANMDAPNDEQATPLFFACQSNNQFAASILVSQGCNVRWKNLQGLTAFDFIMDYDEWIDCGYFADEIRARLKAYSLKHARNLIRAISKRVKGPQKHWGPRDAKTAGAAMTSSNALMPGNKSRSLTASSSMALAPIPRGQIQLPPLQNHQGKMVY